jgi:hypothetical protein
MSLEAESNSELTVMVPAYQLYFRFPLQNKIHKQKFCRTPGPAFLAVLPVLVIFCPLGPTNFKKYALRNYTYEKKVYTVMVKNSTNINKMNILLSP